MGEEIRSLFLRIRKPTKDFLLMSFPLSLTLSHKGRGDCFFLSSLGRGLPPKADLPLAER
jgi:hypothetical protein